jgi:hypothetical protein
MMCVYVSQLTNFEMTSHRCGAVRVRLMSAAQHHLCEPLVAACCPGRAAAARCTRRRHRPQRRCPVLFASSKPKGFGKRTEGGADTDKDTLDAEELCVDLGVRSPLSKRALTGLF